MSATATPNANQTANQSAQQANRQNASQNSGRSTQQNTETASASRAATETCQAATHSATKLMEDAVRGWSRSMESWLDAQHKMLNSTIAAMPEAMSVPASVEQMVPDFADARQTVERMGGEARRTANRLFHGSVDLSTNSMTEMAAMVTDHARFMGRLADRAADCIFGDHAARTPESFAATVRTMMTDCVENATATSERMVRLGANTVETARTLVTSETPDQTRVKAACDTTCDTTSAGSTTQTR